MEAFAEAFVEVNLLPLAAFTESFVAVIFFHETVCESFFYVHESFRGSFRGSNFTSSVKASAKSSMEENLLA